MCGVAGVFSVDRPVDGAMIEAVLRMLDRQKHRGPDDWGMLLPKSSISREDVASVISRLPSRHLMFYDDAPDAPSAVIGSRRLSILDLSDASQMPMGTRDGHIWLTYNGEIYNFAELRAELVARGHQFRSTGDTEVVLNGYSEWGLDVVKHLRGMFAFALLDVRNPREPQLLLARDRFGIKPLYWHRGDGAVRFASEVRSLLASKQVQSESEPRGLHGFLVYGSVPAPWTTVRGVMSLPPASTLRISRRAYSIPTTSSYWSIPAPDVDGARDEAVDRVRGILDDVVRRHLVADVPTGIFLSGGIDSSALLSYAARHATQPLTTLCVTFDEDQYAEGRFARRVAKRFGTNHVEVKVDSRSFLEEIPAVLDAMDQPTSDGVNTYVVAKAAKQAGLTVVLSGVGGDELFWGYPGFTSAPRLDALRRVPGVALAAGFAADVARRFGLDRLEKVAFLGEPGALGSYLAVRGLFPPRSAARLLNSEPLPLCAAAGTPATLDAHGYARLEFSHYLQNQLLRDTDVFGMAHSVEIRVPFLDHVLAETVFRMPVPSMTYGTWQKPLLMRTLDSELQRMLQRPKMGFTFPFDKWLRDGWPEIERNTSTSNVLDGAGYDRVVGSFKSGRRHWSRAWTLAVLNGTYKRGLTPVPPSVSSPKRILFILPQLYGGKGGILEYNQQLIRAVSEAFPLARLAVISANDASAPEDAPARGRVHFVGLGPRSKLLHKTRLVIGTLLTALNERPDLMVCGHVHLGPLALASRLLWRSRTILIAHGIEAWQPRSFHRWTSKRFDRVLPVSRFTAERMRNWGVASDSLRIVPNTVDSEVFRPIGNSISSSRTLLTVARLDQTEQYKGVDKVIRILPALMQQFPELTYDIAGDGSDLPRLKQLVADLQLGDRVRFLGRVPESDLPALYTEASAFVMPSLKEGFGIVFLESLACGTPVVAGNRDGSVDAVLDGILGELVDPDDATALREAIARVLRGEHVSKQDLRKTVVAAYGFDQFRAKLAKELESCTSP